MDAEKNSNVLIERDSKAPSFETVLDTTCERLLEKHIQYSIRRLGEMDEELARLEKELDDFLSLKK